MQRPGPGVTGLAYRSRAPRCRAADAKRYAPYNIVGKLMKNIVGLMILGFIGYTVYPIMVGGEKMKTFCETVLLKESKETLLDRAQESGYSSRDLEKQGQILLIDSTAMGRYICEVTISDNKVTGAKYVFNN
jgi:hypothetical protein